MEQNKLKSPILRAGLVAIVLMILRRHFDYEVPNEVADLIIEIFLYLLSAFAMFNNPNNPNNL